MTEPIPMEVVRDLSDLPNSASGHKSLVWWGNLGFMLIEGTAFALAAAVYLYLMSQTPAWPPAPHARLPDLLWSGIFTAGLLASQPINLWVKRQASAKNAARLRFGTLVMTIVGILLCVARGFELAHLNAPWWLSAYGSVVWMLMVLHTSHLVTDLGDTAVQSLWFYTHVIGDDQFADAEDNCNYWTFVVVAWVPIWGLIYWLPRL
jgi:heme/copper-type cytochrome/quinol oxidase subunit 3